MAAHAEHEPAESAPAEYDQLPAAHDEHAVELGAAANLPSGHGAHTPALAVAEKKPGAHTSQSVPLKDEPAEHEHASDAPAPLLEKPALHAHDAGLAGATPALEVEFPGHDAQRLEVELKKNPALQEGHDVAPDDTVVQLPCAHAVQADELDEAAKDPAAQGVHEAELGSDEDEPAGQTVQRVPLRKEPAGHKQASESLTPEVEKPLAHTQVEGLRLVVPAVEFEFVGQEMQVLDKEL